MSFAQEPCEDNAWSCELLSKTLSGNLSKGRLAGDQLAAELVQLELHLIKRLSLHNRVGIAIQITAPFALIL